MVIFELMDGLSYYALKAERSPYAFYLHLPIITIGTTLLIRKGLTTLIT
jgi:hypothetical protein